MSDIDRQRNQEAFLEERIDVIVATVAFGMGIDKPNVRYVLHSGMPKSLEAYQQESGRAGRDGLEAECTLLYSGGDAIKWKQMMQNSGETGGGDGQDGALAARRDGCVLLRRELSARGARRLLWAGPRQSELRRV